MAVLYQRHLATIQTEFANLLQSVEVGAALHIGTPGTIEGRARSEGLYAYHRYYDAAGKACERYIAGPLGTPGADLARAEVMDQIARTKLDVSAVKMFRKLNYVCIDDKSNAVLAAMHNHGLFEGGLTLVGSHAYGAMLNNLGVSAKSYLTEDIDVARLRPLHMASREMIELIDILRSSGLPFIKVSTGLRPGGLAVTHKLPGAERIMVDLLVNGTEVGQSVLVPELGVHAQSIPHLDYLVGERMRALGMSKNHVVPIFVPTPARFAVHKMFSAKSRINQFAKSDKDLQQAATLVCVIEDLLPGDIADAMTAFPLSSRLAMLAGAHQVLNLLQSVNAEQAAETLVSAIGDLEN